MNICSQVVTPTERSPNVRKHRRVSGLIFKPFHVLVFSQTYYPLSPSYPILLSSFITFTKNAQASNFIWIFEWFIWFWTLHYGNLLLYNFYSVLRMCSFCLVPYIFQAALLLPIVNSNLYLLYFTSNISYKNIIKTWEIQINDHEHGYRHKRYQNIFQDIYSDVKRQYT